MLSTIKKIELDELASPSPISRLSSSHSRLPTTHSRYNFWKVDQGFKV